MIFVIERLWYNESKNGIVGMLSKLENDVKTAVGVTLEKANKAIPKGVYTIVSNYSPKFKKNLPLVYNDVVPAQRGIRIHGGNTVADSSGCILLGSTLDLKNFKISGCSLPVETMSKLKANYTLYIEDHTNAESY